MLGGLKLFFKSQLMLPCFCRQNIVASVQNVHFKMNAFGLSVKTAEAKLI